jgi:hypothetical protein
VQLPLRLFDAQDNAYQSGLSFGASILNLILSRSPTFMLMKSMTDQSIKLRNNISIMCLVFGPFAGVAGIGVGGILGGCLLAINAIAIIIAVTLSLKSMNASNKTDATEEEMIQRMLRDGSFSQKLKDAKLRLEEETIS